MNTMTFESINAEMIKSNTLLNTEVFRTDKKRSVNEEYQLIHKAIKGCNRSFDLLVSKHTNQVTRFIAKKLKNADLVDDLVQDTFLSAFMNISKFKFESKFSTWVIGIALNAVRNYYNRSPECRYQFTDESELCDKASAQNLLDEAVSQETLDLTLSALENLKSGTREIFELAVIENVPYAEISELHNTSVEAVKIKVFRARKQLKSKVSV